MLLLMMEYMTQKLLLIWMIFMKIKKKKMNQPLQLIILENKKCFLKLEDIDSIRKNKNSEKKK